MTFLFLHDQAKALGEYNERPDLREFKYMVLGLAAIIPFWMTQFCILFPTSCRMITTKNKSAFGQQRLHYEANALAAAFRPQSLDDGVGQNTSWQKLAFSRMAVERCSALI